MSFYLLSKIDIKIAVYFTTTYVFFSTKANIKDLDKLFFWGGNKLNKEVFDWVKFNPNNEKLLKYEQDLKEHDKQKYIIFKYRFREFKSYSDISKLMDIPTSLFWRMCLCINWKFSIGNPMALVWVWRINMPL